MAKNKIMNINKSIICGRLTRDPEVKALQGGTKVASFSVAVNERYTDRNGERVEKTEFVNVVTFGRTAELCGQYLVKGQIAMVEGKIQTRTWEKDDGSKGYKTEVLAHSVQFGPKGGKNEAGDANGEETVIDADTREKRRVAPDSKVMGAVAMPRQAAKDGQIEYPTEDINPEDIPF